MVPLTIDKTPILSRRKVFKKCPLFVIAKHQMAVASMDQVLLAHRKTAVQKRQDHSRS